MTLLTLKNLSVELQQKTILSDVELKLSAGDILGLVGPSGCGKTTLLNTVAGFVEQKQGQILIENEIRISPENMLAPEKRNIGMIFQDYALFPHLTVEQNIAFGIKKLAKEEQKARIENLLLLLQLTDYAQRYPHQLSGGQQQRVAIARALAPRPKLLLLDEPFSNIDARLRNELMMELRGLLKSLDMTAIFVTHNKDEVFTFADQIAVMHQGKVLQSGVPSEVFKAPSCWQVADFLQIGSWLPVVERQQCLVTALGDLHWPESANDDKQSIQINRYLLLKPHNLVVNDTDTPNVKVDYVGVTEQGFHYLVSSLSSDAELKFEQLSFYSDEAYGQGQELALNVIHHDYQLFNQ